MSEGMKEYFVESHSFAAPFCSDIDTGFCKGKSPQDAMERFAKNYKHPAGLFSAGLWNSSDDYHRGKKMLGRWISNDAAVLEMPKTRSRHDGPGKWEIDGKPVIVKKPKEGKWKPAK